MNPFFFLFFVALFSLVKKIDAQTIERQTIGAAQMLTSAEFIVSASVGETARTAAQSGSFFVQQGFEQPSGNVAVAVAEPRVEVFFKIFPNPTAGFLTVELETKTSLVLGFSLFDLNGKLIAELEKKATVAAGFSSRNFDVSSVAAGGLVLQILDEKGRRIESILVEKF